MKNFFAPIALVFPIFTATAQMADHSLAEFPRLPGETDDAPRIQRAVDATPSGVLEIGKGLYEIAKTVSVTNLCSLRMHKSAHLRAVAQMDYVLRVNTAPIFDSLEWLGDRRQDYNMFVTGGKIDGNGLASCMMLDGFNHYTLRDTTFCNGKRYGLAVDAEEGTGYELIAENLYFKCVMPGLAGNTAFFLNGGDCHITDCVSVDYTIGFHLATGGSNRLTRCHAWGGQIPPPREGEPCEMLKDSICFKIGGTSAILRDCYADTGETGYEVIGLETRLIGCSYFSNKMFGLDNMTIVRHLSGRLLVDAGAFIKCAPHCKVYEGCGLVKWQNMMYANFGPDDYCPGAIEVGDGSAQPARKVAD